MPIKMPTSNGEPTPTDTPMMICTCFVVRWPFRCKNPVAVGPGVKVDGMPDVESAIDLALVPKGTGLTVVAVDAGHVAFWPEGTTVVMVLADVVRAVVCSETGQLMRPFDWQPTAEYVKVVLMVVVVTESAARRASAPVVVAAIAVAVAAALLTH